MSLFGDFEHHLEIFVRYYIPNSWVMFGTFTNPCGWQSLILADFLSKGIVLPSNQRVAHRRGPGNQWPTAISQTSELHPGKRLMSKPIKGGMMAGQEPREYDSLIINIENI